MGSVPNRVGSVSKEGFFLRKVMLNCQFIDDTANMNGLFYTVYCKITIIMGPGLTPNGMSP
jgi:hypothetical protein